MKVVEIFSSIEGEGRRAGLPCTFIRFAGCNLRCTYCDTPYGWDDSESTEMSVDEIVQTVIDFGPKHITITGGEPMLQDHTELHKLIDKLTDLHCIINIETNGSCDYSEFQNYNVFITMDYKSPSSGMQDSMRLGLIHSLTARDVLKFVVGTFEDLEVMEKVLKEYPTRAQVFVSPVWENIKLSDIADYLKDHKLYDVKMQVQLHKLIWDPQKRGV